MGWQCPVAPHALGHPMAQGPQGPLPTPRLLPQAFEFRACGILTHRTALGTPSPLGAVDPTAAAAGLCPSSPCSRSPAPIPGSHPWLLWPVVAGSSPDSRVSPRALARGVAPRALSHARAGVPVPGCPGVPSVWAGSSRRGRGQGGCSRSRSIWSAAGLRFLQWGEPEPGPLLFHRRWGWGKGWSLDAGFPVSAASPAGADDVCTHPGGSAPFGAVEGHPGLMPPRGAPG